MADVSVGQAGTDQAENADLAFRQSIGKPTAWSQGFIAQYCTMLVNDEPAMNRLRSFSVWIGARRPSNACFLSADRWKVVVAKSGRAPSHIWWRRCDGRPVAFGKSRGDGHGRCAGLETRRPRSGHWSTPLPRGGVPRLVGVSGYRCQQHPSAPQSADSHRCLRSWSPRSLESPGSPHQTRWSEPRLMALLTEHCHAQSPRASAGLPISTAKHNESNASSDGLGWHEGFEPSTLRSTI